MFLYVFRTNIYIYMLGRSRNSFYPFENARRQKNKRKVTVLDKIKTTDQICQERRISPIISRVSLIINAKHYAFAIPKR